MYRLAGILTPQLRIGFAQNGKRYRIRNGLQSFARWNALVFIIWPFPLDEGLRSFRPSNARRIPEGILHFCEVGSTQEHVKFSAP
jgi:hypothetical protein